MSPIPTPTVMGGGGSPDWASLAIAGAAFLVAVVTLYLSNLKRAEIILDVAPDQTAQVSAGGIQVEIGEEMRIWPTHASASVPLVAYNVGARTGILLRVDLREFHDDPAPALFRATAPRSHVLHPNEAYEGGQLRIYRFPVELELDLPRDSPDFDQLNRRLEGRKVRVVISYRFLRGRSILPWRRSRHLIAERKLTVDLSVEQFRQDVSTATS